MNVLLAVLLCLSWAVVFAEEYYPGGAHGTTVCIEIRPNPHGTPTKVCGPVVHGGSSSRPQQKAADPMIFNLPAAHHSEESDESREAEAPCQKSMMPFPMRQSQPGPGSGSGQQPPHPQNMIQRMDIPAESMPPPMMGMEMMEGWRQAQHPPCPHNQRTPMGMGFPMMPPPMGRPPMANSRSSWMVNPQAMMMRAAEEQALGMAMGMRAAEEKPPGPPPKKESLENLLKECEEKTKLLQEKEAKISELKNQMSSKKEEESIKKE